MITLEELKTLAEVATPGPWTAEPYTRRVVAGDLEVAEGRFSFQGGTPTLVTAQDNANFIAAVRDAVPKLLEMIAGGRTGLMGVCCDKEDCLHNYCKWAREWLARLEEIEQSL